LRNRTHPPPVSTPRRWPANVEAHRDQEVLARRAAERSGGRSCRDERCCDLKLSRASCERVWSDGFVRGWRTWGLSKGARPETKPRARGRISSDGHRLPNGPCYRSAPPRRIARDPRRNPDIVWADARRAATRCGAEMLRANRSSWSSLGRSGSSARGGDRARS
jgi:hypothetical protein